PGREGDPVAQRRDRRLVRSEQPVVKVWLHSTSDASPLAALLLSQILPVFSVVAPCRRGGAPNAAAALGTPGRLARLGATPDFHHGLLVPGRYCRLAQGQRHSNVNSLNRLLRLPVVQISGPDCQERDFGER